MADAQKKKVAAKGKKNKTGSPAKGSFLLKPAVILLVLLTMTLLILGTLYLLRVHPALFSRSMRGEPKRSPASGGQKSSAGEKSPRPGEEVDRLSRQNHGRAPLPFKKNGPLVAIIVDDLGADQTLGEEFFSLRLNLTAAVLPNLPASRAIADFAHTHGHQVLLHLPMEPRDYPVNNPGERALLVELSPREVQERLHDDLLAVPWAVGANNHMGSRFTESREGMREVLRILKEQGFFFVDSRTTTASVAMDEAAALQIASAERDLFLDNELQEGAIRAQIGKLIHLAKEQGSAIAICHPHPETYAALKKEALSFAAAGVQIVPVSELVH